MGRVLITGACGQIGSELVLQLSHNLGVENIVATDIQKPTAKLAAAADFRYLNVLDRDAVTALMVESDIDMVFHLAAILSASGEQNPQLAYDVNMNGLMNLLEASRRTKVGRFITPSSIAAFGPDAVKEKTSDDAVLNPTTMYGVTKVFAEKMLNYYHFKYGMDTRLLRYPGIISSETAPGGGTTDFAVDMYVHAANGQPYTCFVSKETPLPFMYMPDAIKAILLLSEANPDSLRRCTYNVTAMHLTPAAIGEAIRVHIPTFQCDYHPDYRQKIADSWPHSIDDSNAARDWQWKPDFDLTSMTADMLKKLKR